MSQPTSPVDKDWLNNDYEIKEQDRFLPIANGTSSISIHSIFLNLC